MNQLAYKSQAKESNTPTRWDKFKNIITRYPETMAYSAVTATSMAATAYSVANTMANLTSAAPVANSPDKLLLGVTGIGAYSLMSAAFREFLVNTFERVSGAEKLVSGTILAAGATIATTIMSTSASATSIYIMVGATLSSMLYPPLKEIITDTTRSVSQKLSLISSGAFALIGCSTVIAGLGSVHGVGASFAAVVMGGVLTSLGVTGFKKAVVPVENPAG